MLVTHKLADLLNTPDTNAWEFIDGPLTESFAAIGQDGRVIINWRGESYTKMPTTWRSRLINKLNGIGNRKWERQNQSNKETS